ncbi:MAG: hypothetical protein ORN54_14400 [Cyclobacteriaceae bacterium]|nr:hypothetical protein [Cyclobacteriaceae bacterium]
MPSGNQRVYGSFARMFIHAPAGKELQRKARSVLGLCVDGLGAQNPVVRLGGRFAWPCPKITKLSYTLKIHPCP